MTPPELAGDAPIPDVFHPIIICFVEALRHKLDLARTHGLKRRLCQRFHIHKPLFGNERFHRGMTAVACAHVVRIRLHLHKVARRINVRNELLAAFHGR